MCQTTRPTTRATTVSLAAPFERNTHMPKDNQHQRTAMPSDQHPPTDTVTHAQTTAPASCRHTHMLKQASEHQCPQHTSMPKQLQQSTAMYLTPHAGTFTCPMRAPAHQCTQQPMQATTYQNNSSSIRSQ